MIKAVFFDLDGTLLDSAPELCRVTNILLQQHQQKPISLANFRPYVHGGMASMLGNTFAIAANDPAMHTLRAKFLHLYQQTLTENSPLFPGIPAVLSWLTRQGISWGIITNKLTALATPIIEYHGIAQHCQCLIGGETLPLKKPAPDQLLLACRLCDVAPADCCYVGDAETDVIAAQRANMKAIAVSYGYHSQDNPPQQWGADQVVGSATSLQQCLSQWC